MRQISAVNRAKFIAARQAAYYVRDNMLVGLGTGSTAEFLVCLLGRRIREERLHFRAVATSVRIAELGGDVGIDIIDLDHVAGLDLCIDGTDEFDGDYNLIKGAGGALLREKIVANASRRFIVIADDSKKVDRLGSMPLPIEVTCYGWQTTALMIEEMLRDIGQKSRGFQLRFLRQSPYLTDEGNFILDFSLVHINDADMLDTRLNEIPGVIDNGLFTGYASEVVVGHRDGKISVHDCHTGLVKEEMIDMRRMVQEFCDVIDP